MFLSSPFRPRCLLRASAGRLATARSLARRLALLRSRLAEELGKQHVEMVDAVFTLHGVAPAVVGGRAQATLHVFAEDDVFPLDFVAESYGLGHALLGFGPVHVVEKPLENGQCLFR